MKGEQTLVDIVSAMMELDYTGIHTNFGAKDITILSKCDPKDVDTYAVLEGLIVMEEKVRRLKNGLNENVANVLIHKEQIDNATETIQIHETLLTDKLIIEQPTHSKIVSRPNVVCWNHNSKVVPFSGQSRPNFVSANQGLNHPGDIKKLNSANNGVKTTSDQNVFGGGLPTPFVVRQNSHRQDKRHTICRDGILKHASKPQLKMRHKIQGNAQSDIIQGAPPPK